MRRALLLAAYLVGVALFLEGSARLALSTPALFRRVTGKNEAAWRLAWVRRHAKGHEMHYAFDVFSPTRGWALRPGLHDFSAFGRRVSSNSRGLRGAREYAYEKPAGRVRIVVLGDSFSFGEEVGDDETFAHRLEQSLPGTEVLNLGVHGYGQDQMLIYLQEEGVRYQPDVVLLGFLAEDMERNLLGFRDYAKPRFELEGGKLVLRGSPVPPPEEVLRAEPWRSRFVDLLSMLRQLIRARSGAERREMRSLTVALLDAIRTASEAAGARPLYVYFPVREEIPWAGRKPSRSERFLSGYCESRGLACLDLAPAFQARSAQGASLKTVGHWDAAEHAIAADALRAWLIEQGVVARPPA